MLLNAAFWTCDRNVHTAAVVTSKESSHLEISAWMSEVLPKLGVIGIGWHPKEQKSFSLRAGNRLQWITLYP